MANIPEINVAPPTIFNIGPLAVNNAMLAMLAVTLILFVFAYFVRRKAGIVPSRMQMLFEIIWEFMWEKAVLAFGDEKRAKKFFPIMFTLFLILLVSNQFTLIPFIETIVVEGDTSIFRTPTSHYSLPILYTIMVLLTAHVLAFFSHPLRHIGNFIKIKPIFKIKSIKDLPMALLDFFLGLLDIIGEFAKLASLSTRLFGNMFAGSIIVAIIAGLTIFTRYLVPVPFVVLGILSGLVQAFVFVMLSMLFISSTMRSVENNNS